MPLPRVLPLNCANAVVIRAQEMDARGTGVYLGPDYAEKFQHSSDYDYLGIGPPSPKFYRRMPSPRSPIRHTAPDLGISRRQARLA